MSEYQGVKGRSENVERAAQLHVTKKMTGEWEYVLVPLHVS